MTISPAGQIAPIPRRVVAYIIDALIASGIAIVAVILISVLVIVMGPSSGQRFAPVGAGLVWLLMIGWLLTYTAMQGGRGSIGMRAQRIRLVREHTGEQIGFGPALVRNLIFGLSANIVIGYFTPLLDSSGRSQGWHDKVAKALMVEAHPAMSAAAPDVMTTIPPTPVPSRGSVPPPPPLPAPAPSVPPAPSASTVPDETVIAPPRTPPLPPQGAAAAPPAPPASSGLIAFVPGVTQPPPAAEPASLAPPAPAAPPVAPAPPLPPVPLASAEDEEDIESTRISVPGHRLVFTWDDGTRVEVSGRTVFGRNPAPEAGAAVVPVRDETLSLSKTHFEAGAEPAGGWVLDRHSTNGMTIVRGGERIVCTPGEKVRVRLGDAIEIGDRIVTIGGYA